MYFCPPFYVSLLPKHKKQTKVRNNKIKKKKMSFEKMVETYSRTSRTQNSDPSLFLRSKPNLVLEFCIETNTNTSTHQNTNPLYLFFLCFFLKLNFHSFIQSKRTKIVQSLKKIEEDTGESTKPTLSIKI